MFQPERASYITPSVSDGTVLFADERTVYALDSASGMEQWRFSTGDDFSLTSHAIAIANGIVYAANDIVGTLYALDAKSGAKLWDVKTVSGNLGAPVVAGSVLYLGTQQGTLLALDAADGHELWREETSRPINSSPTISDGVVFFSDVDTFYALGDATEPATTGS
jgi:outer membrane protein assembly factor BamB